MKNVARLAAALLSLAASFTAFACDTPVSVCAKAAKTSFPLIVKGQPASLLIESSANSAVKLAAANFAGDLERVGGKAPTQLSDVSAAQGALVIAGVVGQSPLVDEMARTGKIKVSDLTGEWEAYRQIV